MRDVEFQRAVARAVVAGGAGQHVAARHALGDLGHHGALLIGERLLVEDGDVLGHLLQRGGAGQDRRHLRDAEKPAQRPLNRRHVRIDRRERGLGLVGDVDQLPAADGLHDPHGNAVLGEQLDLRARVLEPPVEVVQLHLAELHMLAVGVEEALQHVHAAVDRKAQMADAARLFLLEQVRDRAVLGIVEIRVDVELAHVVRQVEVEVVHLALLELLLEDLLHLAEVGQIVAGELVRQVERIARMACERTADHQLGVAAVVAPRGVEVVDAVLERVVDHRRGGGLVDGVVVAVDHRQAHAAHGVQRQLLILEIAILHRLPPWNTPHEQRALAAAPGSARQDAGLGTRARRCASIAARPYPH